VGVVMVVVGGWWLLSTRRRFKGPVRTPDKEEVANA
jgi:hypothetical protein